MQIPTIAPNQPPSLAGQAPVLALMRCRAALVSPQVSETQPLFCALKALLEELRAELREDARARQRLQQQYAGDKAAWDVEGAALTCRLEQVRPGLLSNRGEGLDPRAWLGKGGEEKPAATASGTWEVPRLPVVPSFPLLPSPKV